jgi:hypothetical protein
VDTVNRNIFPFSRHRIAGNDLIEHMYIQSYIQTLTNFKPTSPFSKEEDKSR